MRLNFRFLLPVIALLILPGMTGCSSAILNMGLGKQSKLEQESAENRVIELISAWQEGEGPGVNNQPVARGFSGQVYFITEGRGLPSEVKGGIRVYLFDDQGTAEEQTKPIYQFDFTPEAWQMHSTMTKLGPAYTLFIPYTRPGRNLAECALRIRYTPPVGPPVYSKMVSMTLGGAKRVLPENELEESEQPITTADGTTTLKTPRSPRKTAFTNSDIMPVGAEEVSDPIRQSFMKTGMVDADFESSDEIADSPSSVGLAHHETTSQPMAKKQKPKKPTSFVDETIEEPTVRSYSIPLD